MIKFESEKHLELFIYSHFDKTGECLIDGCLYDSCVTQMVIGDYGIPDLVFYDESECIDSKNKTRTIHVVELKNKPLKMSHISQICRYKRYFERAFDGFDVDAQYSLVVPESVRESGDAMWLIDQLKGISIVEFTLDPHNGISFEQSSGWAKTTERKEIAMEMFNLSEDDRNESLF